MEPKKSIRDIASSKSNTISDIVSEKPVSKKDNVLLNTVEKTIYTDEENTEFIPEKNKKGGNIKIKNILKLLLKIKPIYSISILIIIILILVLVLIPSPKAKDPVEQANIEAAMVKKELAKHMVLPDNQQIDIRKITSKVEDPFFQNAEIGDYLVIFYENRIAYIYSINKNLIINAGVVFIDPKTATTTDKTNTQ
jgi:hypothetical protein